MDLKQYQYIVKVAELQSITKAANALYITQPSLSHFIAKLEEELGARIFNRNTNPISLTLAGEKYVETARMILALDKGMKEQVLDIANHKKGVITIGMSHARAAFFLPYVLPEFKQQYPGVDIITHERRSDTVEADILKGICDFGILPAPVVADGLETEIICREELILVSGKKLARAKRVNNHYTIEPEDLQNQPFTLLRKGHGIRTAIDVIFMERGIRADSIFETTSNETAYRLSAEGMGMSIVPESTIILSNVRKTPYFYSIGEKGIFWDIVAAYRRQELLNTPQKAVISQLQETFRHTMGLFKTEIC